MLANRNIFVSLAVSLFCLCALSEKIYADTHTAASCSYADVSAAITAASPGDTVNVPAGNCTWSSTLTLSKGLSLIGAGIGNTVITGAGSIIIKFYPSDWSDTTHLYRVSGFSFNLNSTAIGMLIGANTTSSYRTLTQDTPALPKVRVDHNRFYNSTDTNVKAIENRCWMTGVIDNNIFDSLAYPVRNDTQGGAASIHSMWQYSFSHWAPGNDFTIYYEDNTVTNCSYDGSSEVFMDGQYGSRYVARYNTITATGQDYAPLFDFHGDFGGDMVAGFGVEIYGNLIIGGSGDFSALRGGADRSFYNQAGSSSERVQQDACPTDSYWADMITHDVYLFGSRNGATGSLFSNAVTRSTSNCHGYSTLPVKGVQFFDYGSTPPVTMGTLASRPSTCVVGQGYWATNQSTTNLTGMVGVNPSTPISGTLYKCTSTNNWTVFYTPYTYPHPLRGGGVGGPGVLDHFAFNTISTQTAGTAFSVTVTAKDSSNNTVTSFAGTTNLSTTAGTITPAVSGSFSGGVWTGNVTVSQSGSGKTITATNSAGSETGTSGTFTVNPGALDHLAFATISSPQVAGTAFNVTMTAQDVNNNTVTSFTSTVALTTNSGTIGPTTSGSFTSGQRTESVTLTGSGSGRTITATASGKTGLSNTFTVNATPITVNHFAFNTITTQTAGTAFSVTVTAKDSSNNTVTSFTGTTKLSTTAGTITPAISGSFSGGVWTGNVTVSQSGSGKTITAINSAGSETGTSGTFTVNPGALDHFAFATISSPQVAGAAFSVTMTAQDVNNNTVTSFTSTAALATNSGTIGPTTSGSFTSGQRTESVTLTGSGNGRTITATASGKTGTSNTFTVNTTPTSTVYYVDQNHPSANDQNAGTIDLPWKTITKANQTLVAGDTVYIKAGTYTTYILPTNSGTSSNRITYQNYGTDAVTIQNAPYAILLNGKSYITVQGINFYNCDQFMYLQNSANYNIIAYCTFNQGRSNSWTGSIIYRNSSYNWIHHCTFSNYGICDPGHASGSDQGTTLDIGNEEDGTDASNYNVIEDSILFHGGHHVMGIASRYNTIRNNYFHNEAWSNGRGHRNLYIQGVATGSGYNLFEGNRLGYASRPCNDTNLTPSSMALTTSYNIVRYNKIYDSVAPGITLGSYGSPYGIGSYNKIYSNTILNSGYNIDPSYEGGSEDTAIYFSSSSNTGNLVKNNLYYLNYQVHSGVTSSQTFANNWNGDTQGDPKFVNASGTPPTDKTDATLPNLDLQSSSPAIDKGGALTTVTSATGSGTSIAVSNAGYFQDGTYGPAGVVQPDWIAVGTVGNIVQISSISGNTINLANAISWTSGASVWLYKKSDGVQVLYGTAPDAGAYEFSQEEMIPPPTNLRVVSP